MKLTGIAVAMALLSSWAHAQEHRIGVVVATQGQVTVQRKESPPSRKLPAKPLSSIRAHDTLYLGKGSSLTVTLLESGARYTISGVPEFRLPDRNLKALSGKGVTPIAAQPGREALVASHKVDLSRYAGSSSRDVSKLYFDSKVATFDAPQGNAQPQLEYSERNDGSWTAVATSPVQEFGRTRHRVTGLELKPGQAYTFRWAPAEAGKAAPEFQAARLNAADLKAVEKLARKAETDPQLRLSVVEAYLNLHLLDRAEALATSWSTDKRGGSDWATYLHELRQSRAAN